MTAVGANKDFTNVSRERLADMMVAEKEKLIAIAQENAKMRSALEACREYVRLSTGSWWNNRSACDLMTNHIHPALGLDPWAG